MVVFDAEDWKSGDPREDRRDAKTNTEILAAPE
jgi:hypothetical protein